MKKIYRNLLLTGTLVMSAAQLESQCAISGTTNLHGYGCGVGDQIDYFELNGISGSSSGCATNGYYEYYSAPVWSLQIGQTYTWTVNHLSYAQSFAVWIDLNNDGFFSSSEQLANSGTTAYTHSGSFMIPFSAVGGAGHRMRLRCDYGNVIGNTNQTACEIYGPPNYNFYYGETEDYDVYLIPAPPCTGTPVANSVVGPTMSICPGTSAELALATTYTVGGLTFQWQSSTTSSVGPWTNAGSGSMSHITSPINVNTYYQAVVTCTNSNASINAVPALVQVQGVTVDSIPYLEDFEGITENDMLPNCSWTADNLGSEAFTYTVAGSDNRIPRSGSNFASFYYWPGNTNSFYTNGIYLHAGVVYSASVWYTTNQWGDNNWEDLSILIGPNQSPTGQITVASTPGPAISANYKSLSNTFTVASTGVYYAAVRTTVNTNQWAYYLSWDDLEIIAPCALNPVGLNLSTNTSTVCSGTPVTLSASGNGLSFAWSNGSNAPAITVYPTNSEQISVTATSSMTGCKATASQYITVNPTPFVAAVADKQRVCAGGEVNITAVGDASSYVWSTNHNGSYLTFVPVASGPVTVLGTNFAGCTASAVVNITVNPNPVVTAAASKTNACIGDAITLTGSGAMSYKWLTSSTYIQTNPAVVVPNSSVTYTVVGTDANGCTGMDQVSLLLDQCLGISEGSRIAGLRVFPNPGTGVYTIDMAGLDKAKVSVTDLVGREVYRQDALPGTVDISELANGVYYFNVTAEDKSETIRIIKN